MTGIERLRELADKYAELGKDHTTIDVVPSGMAMLFSSIANQIAREHAEDCHRTGLDHGAVSRVVSDMERHVLGHEGMEDSPVARWARELLEALGATMSRHESDGVADTPYDALRPEDREAIAWVRDHGGLDHVRAEWSSRVPYDLYERRRQSLLGHIAECETALGRRNQRIEELGHRVNDLTRENAELRKRAMPEGMAWLIEAWPKFEDDAPVKLGDMALIDGYADMVEAVQIWIHGKPVIYGDNGSQQLEKAERVRRPAVPAADGLPLREGETVWDANGDELVIVALEDGGRTVTCRYADVGDGIPVHGMWSPSDLTHTRPVLDADGNRIEPAMDVWWVCEGDERGVHAERLHVDGIDGDGMVECSPYNGGTSVVLDPAELYVKKPALDAGGVLCREGDEVWEVRSHRRREIVGTHYRDYKTGEPLILCDGDDAVPIPATCVTHTKPEIDSWERIEEDAAKNPFDYCKDVGHRLDTCENSEAYKARDIVRRAKALAERERGE